MITVVCVLSEAGKKYNYSHVERLRNQIKLKQPYRFVCLDDSPYPHWFAKLSLFEPNRFQGRVLYLDLDVEVVDYLDEITDFPWPFGIIKDWNVPGYNSSVMVWDAGYLDHLYTLFSKDPEKYMERYHGDQNFITEYAKAAKFTANWCQSIKKPVESASTKVICWHGRVKPWDVK